MIIVERCAIQMRWSSACTCTRVSASLGHQCAGDRGALRHAPGKLVRIGFLEPGEVHKRDMFGDDLRAPGFRHVGVQQGQLDILFKRHPREEPVILKDDAAIEAGGNDALAIQPDFAGIIVLEADDQAQQGRFAAARCTHDADEFAWPYCQIDAVEYEPLLAIDCVALAHPADRQRTAARLGDVLRGSGRADMNAHRGLRIKGIWAASAADDGARRGRAG
jgi:hypothetical protein